MRMQAANAHRPLPARSKPQVYVRVRSPNAREVAAGAPACVSIQGGGRSLVLAEAGRPEPLVATFDRVLGPEAGQEAVYGAVGAQMVDNVMAGECVMGGWCQTEGRAGGTGAAQQKGGGWERCAVQAPGSSRACGLCLPTSCCQLTSQLTPQACPSSLRSPTGFNSSVFVYGQTGAGKTYTITGDVERREDGALAEEVGKEV